jgi:rubredoxin
MSVRKWKMKLCIVCNNLYDKHLPGARMNTCGDVCHKTFIDNFVARFGEFKKVTDGTTGKSYKVPTRVICEKGIRQQELNRYPLWTEE